MEGDAHQSLPKGRSHSEDYQMWKTSTHGTTWWEYIDLIRKECEAEHWLALYVAMMINIYIPYKNIHKARRWEINEYKSNIGDGIEENMSEYRERFYIIIDKLDCVRIGT